MNQLALDLIRVDGGTQSRAALYQNVVDDYASAIGDGATFPPVVVFHDGSVHWLADGFHRHAAHAKLGLVDIDADVRQGTRRDAILYSVGANETHGLRRTNEDKRRAVMALLGDEEWSAWSDREIARRCVVSHPLVIALRKTLTGNSTSDERTYVTKHGTPATMDTSRIGLRPFDPHQEREHVEAYERIRAANEQEQAPEREEGRRENDFYPTPESIVAEIVRRWKPRSNVIWEPCSGDDRVAMAFREAGFDVMTGDIATGQDFFQSLPPPIGVALCTNPPFDRVREFIDHAFDLGISEMCLVLPERIWASGIGRQQFERHRPAIWVNLDWREDYLGKGGSADRALAVAIWDGPCAANCDFEVWTRQ